ncbi:hypothetical protein CHUAL_001105 [Chamberlinius hualienensis]
MYYGHNSFTNRLIGTHRQIAYAPQGLQVLGKAEQINPYPTNYAKAVPSASPAAGAGGRIETVRAASKAAAHGQAEYGPVPERILRLRAKFQKAEHLPVHLKGGPLDYVLFYLTAGLVVFGAGLAFKTIYSMSFPKRPEE